MNKNRKEGIMKTLSSEGIVKNIIVFDTETHFIKDDNGNIEFPFKLGYAINLRLDMQGNVLRERDIEAYNIESLQSFFLACSLKKEPLYIFAHNIGFDLRVLDLVSFFRLEGFVSEPPIINNMVFIWTLRRDKEKIVLIDTANLGVRSVASLGKDLGLDKLTIDFENTSDSELMIYCKRDVEILKKFIVSYLNFLLDNRLGSFKPTLASQALTAFRTSFLKEDLYIHNHVGATYLERDSYYGGRSEAFRLGYIGEGDYYYLDVNSMYPHAMIDYDLPNRLYGYSENSSVKELKTLSNRFYLIADVTIFTNSNMYPLRLEHSKKSYNFLHNPEGLPYPKTNSKRLIFPVGRFRTTLHHVELLEALKEKAIIKVHRIAWYDKVSPFKDYINFFYTAKNKYGNEGNLTYRTISKLFLNSLYGKFGQLQPYRECIGMSNSGLYDRETGYSETLESFYQEVTWEGLTYLEYKKGETAFSNPALAGAITANARIALYNFILLAGKENVYYCDTDSLMTNKQGYENLRGYIDKDKIGYLKLEHRARRLVIRAIKDYRLDSVRRFKGLPSTAKKQEPNLWEYINFQGFISWLNEGLKGLMKGKVSYKSRRGEYTKGIVDEKGIIHPFYLSE